MASAYTIQVLLLRMAVEHLDGERMRHDRSWVDPCGAQDQVGGKDRVDRMDADDVVLGEVHMGFHYP